MKADIDGQYGLGMGWLQLWEGWTRPESKRLLNNNGNAGERDAWILRSRLH